MVVIIEHLKKYYYMCPLNYKGNINNNLTEGITSEPEADVAKKNDNYKSSQDSGIPDKKSKDSKVEPGKYFVDKKKMVSALRPYEGDVILQGRFGNNLRFGSNSKDKTNLPQIKISLIDDEDVKIKDESLDKDNSLWLSNDGKMEFINTQHISKNPERVEHK